MSYEQRPYLTHGAQNQSYQVGTFPPYSSAENFPQAQPCVTASSVFYSSVKERQLPLVLTGHAVQYSNRDYQYQPVAWNGDHHRAATEHAAYSVYEANQNYACWNEPCRKGNFVQYVPSVNTCSEKFFNGRLLKDCQEKCGHSCGVICASSCPPCKEKCEYRCRHSRCRKSCCEPCVDCVELCGLKCEHYSCSLKCFEFCIRPPCDEPCRKRLPCGHSCIGLCGETCPPLCRVCHKDQLTEFILYGNEEDDDARFIYLEDGMHTIEVEGMQAKWMGPHLLHDMADFQMDD